ncbi:hypothetical protein B2G47_05820 [Leptospira interrogans serovar Canicola]|nr:hypothetical protein B2G47_05820 [Leptospira interrogans serovar Canicola]
MIDFQNNRIQFHQSSSPWIRSFSLESIKCLIVCRGPVRKEAMEIFDSIGIREYGILLSEKDSVVYPMALAPELRGFRFPNNIHRVPDYMGAGKEEKMERIEQIIASQRITNTLISLPVTDLWRKILNSFPRSKKAVSFLWGPLRM